MYRSDEYKNSLNNKSIHRWQVAQELFIYAGLDTSHL